MREESSKLVEQYAPFALRVYSNFAKRLPDHVDHGAVRGAALEGLCQAAVSFDSSKGVPFQAWALRRIVGRMQDEMRENDHLSRRARKRIGKETDDAYDPTYIKAHPGHPVSLETVLGTNDGNTLMDMLQDVHALDPAEHIGLSHDQLFAMLSRLPDREFRVITLRYFGGMRLRDVANAMTLSESRVSQLEGRALDRMREEAGE